MFTQHRSRLELHKKATEGDQIERPRILIGITESVEIKFTAFGAQEIDCGIDFVAYRVILLEPNLGKVKASNILISAEFVRNNRPETP